ncbi:MAG: type II toxin-antitoxin system RelE family toxin [Patescibacteria group bacterium]
MEIKFVIYYHPVVVNKDIPGLTNPWKQKIKKAIEDKSATNPYHYGKPLRRSLVGYRKLRVGDYRVIFRIDKNKIIILAIMNRRDIYKKVHRRI